MKKLQYRDVLETPANDNEEPFVNGDEYSTNIYLTGMEGQNALFPFDLDLKIRRPSIYPNAIYALRESAAKRLAMAADNLRKSDNSLRLVLAYGYRPLEIQTEIFERIKKEFKENSEPETSEIELMERVNQIIAVPEVAGHPTGGATDVAIWKWSKTPNIGQYLDMGYPLLDLNGDPKQMSSEATLTDEQIENRRLLQKTMTESGFAPFWGEWWHFSYGDREWATYYSTPEQKLEGIYTAQTINQATERYQSTQRVDLFNNGWGRNRLTILDSTRDRYDAP